MSVTARLHLFILIDALGWRLLEGREFLSALLPYRMPLRTVLGYSSGAIPTILTGLPPARHGHWNLFYYDPEGSPFRWLRYLQFLPDRMLNNRVTRKLVKEMGRRLLGLGPLFECCVSPRLLPFLNWVEKRNIYGLGGITGAHSIFDRLAEHGIPYCLYSYHDGTDGEILRRARRDLEAREAKFYFIYLSEMDHFLHNHRDDDGKVKKQLEWYDSGLRELFERAKMIDPEANFTVISDHGMAPVRHRYDLVKDVEALGFTMPTDYLAVYDSTMARFWFFNDRARRRIIDYLVTVPCGRIVPDDELQRLGIHFPDQCYGELIFVLYEGWIVARSDFNGRGWMPVGMHGYHPDDADSDAIFLSNVRPPVDVRTIADVYRCMEAAARMVTN